MNIKQSLFSKQTLFFAFACFFFLGQQAAAQEVKKVNYTKCFEVISKTWQTHCDSNDSFEIRWKNVCEETMDLKYAIRKTDGSWEVGIDFGVEPGEETVNVAWVCHGTGHYLWWARPSAQWMDIKFPSDEEIQKAK